VGKVVCEEINIPWKYQALRFFLWVRKAGRAIDGGWEIFKWRFYMELGILINVARSS
jgi:hypothetical protein